MIYTLGTFTTSLIPVDVSSQLLAAIRNRIPTEMVAYDKLMYLHSPTADLTCSMIELLIYPNTTPILPVAQSAGTGHNAEALTTHPNRHYASIVLS